MPTRKREIFAMFKFAANPYILNPLLIYFSTDAVPLVANTLFTGIALYSDHITALVIALLLMPFAKQIFEY